MWASPSTVVVHHSDTPSRVAMASYTSSMGAFTPTLFLMSGIAPTSLFGNVQLIVAHRGKKCNQKLRVVPDGGAGTGPREGAGREQGRRAPTGGG